MKKSFIVILILCITALVVIFGVLTLDPVVAEINGKTIRRSLFVEIMASMKSEVINEYAKLDGTSIDPPKRVETTNLSDYWKERAL